MRLESLWWILVTELTQDVTMHTVTNDVLNGINWRAYQWVKQNGNKLQLQCKWYAK